jgi:hypothetical protein
VLDGLRCDDHTMDELPTDKDDLEREPPGPAEGQPEPERLPDGNYVGEDNIREGHVGGIIGGPHQQGGEGQGG